MNKAARDAQNEYIRAWRKKNPEKVKAYMEKYWTKRAIAPKNAEERGPECGKTKGDT